MPGRSTRQTLTTRPDRALKSAAGLEGVEGPRLSDGHQQKKGSVIPPRYRRPPPVAGPRRETLGRIE